MKPCTLLLLCCGGFGSYAAQASTLDISRPEVQAFIEAASAEQGLDRGWVESILAGAKPQSDILRLISRPAEKRLRWGDYRLNFLDERTINAGVAFWQANEDRLAAVEQQTGVDRRVIVGILGVETRYGRVMGRHRVLDALVTLGFDYPPRSKYFLDELGHFLALAREGVVSPLEAHGSYAGAMGFGQFMPSSYRNYAVDGNGDGRRDLFTDWDDAILSIANYLVQHGWRGGEPVLTGATVAPSEDLKRPASGSQPSPESVASLKARGITFETTMKADSPARLINVDGAAGPIHMVGFHNFSVIMRYNRSTLYALAVEEVGRTVAMRATSKPR